ncbi:hypothetical protein HK101_009221 [Irineochytrium annulatum]|nr:hypothetical protein HK101_009221 [Irineochytrium annulatum]
MPSLFAQRRAREKAASAPSASSAIPVEAASVNWSREPYDGVLRNIVEKDLPTRFRMNTTQVHATGFPSVERLPNDERGIVSAAEPEVLNFDREAAAGMDAEIHRENVGKVLAMTDEEKEEAMAQIYATMDPGVIKMLRKRAAGRYAGVDDSGLVEHDVKDGDVKNEKEGAEKKKLELAEPFITERVDKKSEDFERKKLEWTEPLPATENATDGYLRFDLDGLVIHPDDAVDPNSGLYHHGDAPSAPGYTIHELDHLLRSAVPAQRITALRTIGLIIANLRTGRFSEDEAHVIEEDIYASSCLIQIRCSIDDAHKTAISVGLECLYICMGGDAGVDTWREEIYPRHGGVRRGRAAAGDDEKQPETLEDFSAIFRADFIEGMNATNVIARLFYLMNAGVSSKTNDVLILRILALLCGNSRKAANDLVEHHGFLRLVGKRFICVTWPTADEKVVMVAQEAVRLLVALCSGSGERAKSVEEAGLLDNIFRFISVDARGNTQAMLGLNTECYRLLEKSFAAGVSERMFQEYRKLFLEKAAIMSKVVADQSEDADIRAMAFWRMVSALEGAFTDESDKESYIDALFPFVPYAAQYLESSFTTGNQDNFAPLSACLEVVAKFISVVHKSATDHLYKFDTKLFQIETAGRSIVTLACEDVLNFKMENLQAYRQGRALTGVVVLPSVEQVLSLHFRCLFLRAYMKVVATMPEVKSGGVEVGRSLMPRLHALLLSPERGDMLPSGLIELQGTIAEMLSAETREGGVEEYRDVMKAAFLYVLRGGADRRAIAANVLLGSRSLRLMNVSEEGGELLRDILGLALSQGISDWIFYPIEFIASNEVESADCIISATLSLVKAFFLELCAFSSHIAVLAHLFKCTTLAGADHEAILSKLDIASKLDVLLTACCRNISTVDLNTFMGGGAKFYNLYQHALSHYTFTPSHDKAFTKFITIPLQMTYPPDFRLLFWGECEDHGLLPRIALDWDETPVTIEAFLEPLEVHPSLLEAYAKALAQGLHAHGLLERIAVHHLSGFVFGEDGKDASRVPVVAGLPVEVLKALVLYGGVTEEAWIREEAAWIALENAKRSSLIKCSEE